MASGSVVKDKPLIYFHANNSANFVGGTTKLEDTGVVSDKAETYVVILKIHVSVSGTVKININDGVMFNMETQAGMDYCLAISKAVAANTQVQIQFLSTSTATVSSYFIICIPCTPKGV